MKLVQRPLAALVLAAPLLAQAPSLPDPSGPLRVRGGAEPSTLLEVATAYAERLGLPLAPSGDAEAVLGRAKVGLLADVEVPADAVHGVAQSLLVLGGFVITGVEGALAVAAYADEGRAALPVDEAALAALAGHEAVLVRVPASIEGIDARALAASLRMLSVPGIPGPALTARDEAVLELEGPAESVRQMLAVLRLCADPAAAVGPFVDLATLLPAVAAGGRRLAIAPEDSVLAALERYVALTGRVLWIEERLRQQLAHQETGLLAPIACDAARAHAVVEALLASHDVAITVRGPAAHAIHALQRGYRVAAVRPVLVDLDRVDLGILRDHPATVFGGVATLPDHEVRQLTVSLRTMMTDVNTQLALALADHALYLHGAGGSAAQLAALFADLAGRTPAGEPATAGFSAVTRPSGDLEVGAASAPGEADLLDLLDGWSRATGRTVLLPAPARQVLGRRLPESPLRIPAAELDLLAEGRLNELGFGLSPYVLDPPVYALVGGGLPRRLAAHRYVAADALESLADHPAHLVTTSLALERLEVRRAATLLRGRMRDASKEHLIAAGDRIVLGGTVGWVRDLVAEMREYDAAGELPSELRGR